jgi:hypothetical protein
VNREELFDELDGLTDEQIKMRLEAGVWSEEERPSVEHYLSAAKLRRGEAVKLREVARRAQVRSSVAIKLARRTHWRLTNANGLSIAAMVVAVASLLLTLYCVFR